MLYVAAPSAWTILLPWPSVCLCLTTNWTSSPWAGWNSRNLRKKCFEFLSKRQFSILLMQFFYLFQDIIKGCIELLMDKSDLLERCKQGDREAFGELYSVYVSRMRKVCRKYIKDEVRSLWGQHRHGWRAWGRSSGRRRCLAPGCLYRYFPIWESCILYFVHPRSEYRTIQDMPLCVCWPWNFLARLVCNGGHLMLLKVRHMLLFNIGSCSCAWSTKHTMLASSFRVVLLI